MCFVDFVGKPKLQECIYCLKVHPLLWEHGENTMALHYGMIMYKVTRGHIQKTNKKTTSS